jgi:DNA-binding response OmpR family regulator
LIKFNFRKGAFHRFQLIQRTTGLCIKQDFFLNITRYIHMKTINSIAVFDLDPCFLAMLKGYCYANVINLKPAKFDLDGIIEVANLKPDLIIVHLDRVNPKVNNPEAELLRRLRIVDGVKICALNKNPNEIFSSRLSDWLDAIITNPTDPSEIDAYIKNKWTINSHISEERRSTTERRRNKSSNGSDEGVNFYHLQESEHAVSRDFQIDQRNKKVFLKGNRIDLTPKEFELIELLLTDVDRIFKADEIINHLWPENKRATKSDLYQYMHLLRKKIEKDPNNPRWIMNVKGFGYKLNSANCEEYRNSSQSQYFGAGQI